MSRKWMSDFVSFQGRKEGKRDHGKDMREIGMREGKDGYTDMHLEKGIHAHIPFSLMMMMVMIFSSLSPLLHSVK